MHVLLLLLLHLLLLVVGQAQAGDGFLQRNQRTLDDRSARSIT
jgi:hypothetical protein